MNEDDPELSLSVLLTINHRNGMVIRCGWEWDPPDEASVIIPTVRYEDDDDDD